MNLKIRLIKINKKIIAKTHNKLFLKIFNKSNNLIFYINDLKIGDKINVAIIHYKIN